MSKVTFCSGHSMNTGTDCEIKKRWVLFALMVTSRNQKDFVYYYSRLTCKNAGKGTWKRMEEI